MLPDLLGKIALIKREPPLPLTEPTIRANTTTSTLLEGPPPSFQRGKTSNLGIQSLPVLWRGTQLYSLAFDN